MVDERGGRRAPRARKADKLPAAVVGPAEFEMVVSVALETAAGFKSPSAQTEVFHDKVGSLALYDDLKARCLFFRHLSTSDVPILLHLGLGDLVHGRVAANRLAYRFCASVPLLYKLPKASCPDGTIRSVEWSHQAIDEHARQIRNGIAFDAAGYCTRISTSLREFATPLCGPSERPFFTATEMQDRMHAAMMIWNACVLSKQSGSPFDCDAIAEALSFEPNAKKQIARLADRKRGLWDYDMRLITKLVQTPDDGSLVSIRAECMDVGESAVRRPNGEPTH